MIVVYGASGVAGEAVAAALVAGGMPVVLAGRDRARLTAVQRRLAVPGERPGVAVAAAHDRAALDRVVAGASVVIGCAGPFAQVGGGLVTAAVAAGAHYLDIAGDQAFLRAMHEEHDAEARHRGTIVLPGLGLGALGDWAARWAARSIAGEPPRLAAGSVDGDAHTRLADDAPLDELIIGHAVDGFAPAPGARRSLIDAATGPGVVWRAGRWDPTRPAARGRTIDFGALGARAARSFPAAEIISAPRHIAARTVDAFIALPDDPWARGLGRLTPLAGLAAPLAGWVAPLLATFVDPTQVPDADARARARFAIVATARRGFDHAQVRVSGHDVYALTARVVADAARALAAPSAALTAVIRDGGARAPSQVFGAAATLTALEAAGAVTVETSFAPGEPREPTLV